MIDPKQLGPKERSALIQAAILETCCLIAGVIGYFLTANSIWIVIGLVAGAGFSIPAIIKLIRAREGARDAPR